MYVIKRALFVFEKIKRVHYVGEDHDNIPFVASDRAASDIHGTAARADQVDFHTGVQMLAESIIIGAVLDCCAGDGICIKGMQVESFFIRDLLCI